MPIIAPTRLVLRGRIRAQTRYAVTLTGRLLRAYAQNPALHLFQGATGQGSTEDMIYIQSIWNNALSQRTS